MPSRASSFEKVSISATSIDRYMSVNSWKVYQQVRRFWRVKGPYNNATIKKLQVSFESEPVVDDPITQIF